MNERIFVRLGTHKGLYDMVFWFEEQELAEKNFDKQSIFVDK